MASTYSNLKIQLMATGENSGTWGNVTNANLGDAIEQALVETATVTFASANITLTLSDSNSRQNARALRLNLTGTTGGARDLIVPAIQKPYIVNNGTANIITVKVSGQTGVAVPVGKTMTVYNNGTDVVDMITHLSSLTLNAATPLGAASGGTGLNASGTAGNVLTSNGSAWTSVAAAAFDAGTVMLFAQTTAPTGWTKNTTTGNQHALRIVTGTASSGGSVDFTTAFASKPVTGSVTVTASTGQVAQGGTVSSPASTGQVAQGGTVSVSASVGNTTLSTPQIPSHTHTVTRFLCGGGTSSLATGSGPSVTANTGATGGGGAHAHPISAPASFSGQQHAHPVTVTSSFSGQQHAHPVSAPASFSGTAIDLAVRYIDVIRATKN